MAYSIYEPTKREQEMAAGLRTVCVDVITQRDSTDIAGLLGLARLGLERLLWEPVWDLRVAVRVAEALDLTILSDLTEGVQQAAEGVAA